MRKGNGFNPQFNTFNYERNTMENKMTKNLKKIVTLDEKIKKQQEEKERLEELDLKRSYYVSCCIDVWNNFGSTVGLEGVNLDGVEDYIFGSGDFDGCFDWSDSHYE